VFLRQSHLPMFFAVADDDQYPFMVEITELLYTVSGSPGKKFIHYQTGHHAAEMFSVHPDLQTAITDWYLTTLVRTPGKAPAITDVPQIPEEIHDYDLLDQPGGPAKLREKLAAARQRDPKAPFLSEQGIEGLAWEHLQAKDFKQTFQILRLDAAAYPDAPNVYDFFGEAYLATGQKELARQNSQKALDLLPSDTTDPQSVRDAIKTSAEERLKKLDGTKEND